MGEIIFALLMFLNGKLENYSPKANLAECLEQKRKVERDGISNTLRMECKQIEVYVSNFIFLTYSVCSIFRL